MASDAAKKPGRGFASTARASAVTRFIKKHIGVGTVNSTNTGDHGIRVDQEPYASQVTLSVRMRDEQEAIDWAKSIAETFADHGFEVKQSGFSSAVLIVSKPSWRHDDHMIRLFSLCLGVPAKKAIATDNGLINAPAYIIDLLREQGVFEDDTLRLSELGQQARAWALADAKKLAAQARRRSKEFGY